MISLLASRWTIVAVLFGLLGLFAGYERIQVANAQSATSKCVAASEADKVLAANERAQAISTAASAADGFHAEAMQWKDRAITSEEKYAMLQPEHVRALDANRALLADNGRLRNNITSFAAGPGSSASAADTVAAASQRAATLGGLLATALQSDADSSKDAESNGDAVRALLSAWPTAASASAASAP